MVFLNFILRLFLTCRFYRTYFLKCGITIYDFLILDLRFRTDRPTLQMKLQHAAPGLGRRPAGRTDLLRRILRP